MVLPRYSQSSTEVYVTNADTDWGSEALFVGFANPHRDFLDIGAHVGYYSCYLSPRVRRVYAFEPDPRNIPSLRFNALMAGNIEVIEAAVSSHDGTAALRVGKGPEVSSLQAAGAGETSIGVNVMTVDTFVAARPGVDVALIKTDVEGHDLEVLRGMQAVVDRHQSLILSECSYTPELRDLCDRWHYRIFAFMRGRLTANACLREMLGPASQQSLYKMLFLVPPHLAPSFSKLASNASS